MKHCRTTYKIMLIKWIYVPVFKLIMWVNNFLNCVIDTHKETGLLSSHVIETLSFHATIQTR
jgi:hypothetical protein